MTEALGKIDGDALAAEFERYLPGLPGLAEELICRHGLSIGR